MQNDLALEAELLTLDFKSMLVKWGSNSPTRRGMHASAVLVADSEWCTREQVLLNLFPESAEKPPMQSWDWRLSAIFENGWRLHQRWQDLFKKHGNVVWSPATSEQIPGSSHGKLINGQVHLPELDLTHHDEDRGVYFSPDALIRFGGERYVVEIKGVNHDAFVGTPRDEQGNFIPVFDANGKPIKPQEGLSDDLEQAARACETVYKAKIQVNLYLHLLGLDKGIILVENKSTQDFKVWVVEYNRELVYPYTNRINEVRGRTLLSRKSLEHLPARRCQTSDDPRAKRCPLRKVCFEER